LGDGARAETLLQDIVAFFFLLNDLAAVPPMGVPMLRVLKSLLVSFSSI
jgi:hypothetical protein